MKKFLIIILLVLFLPSFCSATQSYVFAYINNDAQVITPSTETRVQFNAERADLLNEWDNSATSTFTASQAGYYYIKSSVRWAGAVDQKIFVLFFNINSSNFTYSQVNTSGTGSFSQEVSAVVYLNISDKVNMSVFQNTTVNKNLTASVATTWPHLSFISIWKLDEAGGGGGATWGSIAGTLSNQTDLQTALNNLNMDKYFQLISNTSTGAEFYLEKTMDYGQALIIFFFTLFTICLICLVIWRFFWKK